MELLKTLKFVRGAVSNKSANIEMQYFMIEGGHIRATNGVMSLGAPIDLGISCSPRADVFYKAIGQCKDVVSLKYLENTDRLSVGSGKFRAFIPCMSTKGLHPRPSGIQVQADGQALYSAFEKLEKFVCKDDLRPWTNGVLLKGQSAFATNNVCLVEFWIGVELPFVANVPLPAVKEVLSAGAPDALLMDASSITFWYDDGRWIKTQLYADEWPNLSNILESPATPVAIPDDLFVGLKAVKEFSDKEDRRVWFRDGMICASLYDDDAATYKVEGLAQHGCYRAEMLGLLEGVATTADFSTYPEPVVFYGDRIRGAILGLNT